MRIVIVGGGLAAAKLSESLRELDFPGEIAMLCAEDRLPYERPPLSKEYAAGKKSLDEFTVQPASWYRDHHVDLLLGTEVTAIDRSAHTVRLPDGYELGYDKLALATGSRARTLDLPGFDARGVFTLRSVDDSDALLGAIAPGARLAIVGAGWIGLEIAAAARAKGVEVTILESAELPLLAVLGPELGTVFADLHRSHGVDFRFGAKVGAVAVRDGAATGVQLDDGTVIDATAVLVAIGARPNIELARDAGLAVADGVLVDESLRTSDPDIVAVGDIAEQQHPVLERRIRVEHWANALNQPAVAAHTLVGQPRAYDRLPYFFTDQYDLGMEYVGHAPNGEYEQVVVRGDTDRREFLAFWLDRDRRVLAGMNVNIWDQGDAIRELIAAARPVDVSKLADPTVPLGMSLA